MQLARRYPDQLWPAPRPVPVLAALRMPQDYRVPAHWHTTNEHITVVKGNPSFTAKGGETITTRPGTYLFLPGKTAHSGQCGDTEACVLSSALDKALDSHAEGAKRWVTIFARWRRFHMFYTTPHTGSPSICRACSYSSGVLALKNITLWGS
jgi:hypothetical protein